ncbi:cyanophycin synthetase [Pseudoduganella namucuonensis]|uniref:Cyanophycin synthetase n=1 Tax=Pseudoduganella namucuonensis TaxID=1035707 RepID=A0A1I7M3B7_9BURK|nr:cyanophycin synthetase [Pseudoduganella namucuonensis]SFV16452.1 cyanophycin synthetase [Pseudoduganella namucuonensis]
MNIIEQRLLRGPNLYARRPCLLTVLDLGELGTVSSITDPDFTGRLLELLPALHEHRCSLGQYSGFAQSLRGGTNMAHVVEHVTLALQCLAGPTVSFGRTRPVAGHDSRYRVVCAYEIEQLAGAALVAALELVETLARGGAVDLDAVLAPLRETASRHAIGTSTAAVLAAARKRGIPYSRLTDEANLFQLGWGGKQKRLQATITGNTGHVAVGVAADKQLTKLLLKEAGVPVPNGGIAATAEEARQLARRMGGVVTVKPLDGNHGRGVSTGCATTEEVLAAYERAREHGRRVIVERHIEGHDYRVLVAGKRVAAAALRRPPSVTGDGASTVRELVERENRNPARGEGHSNILSIIPLDGHAEGVLAKQGYGLDSIPEAGTVVTLRGNANLSTGGTAEDVTDLLPQETCDICVRAARKVGLDIAGIDVVCADISRPLREQGGAVIEVNAAPGIRMHHYPSAGMPRDAGAAIVEALYGEGNGRIPVIAVTGTNGKTTTTLMLEHTARLAGLATGCTTTEGVYVAGKRIVKGDCSGYWSARTVLGAPEVDFAVLETARGGILKRGLAFDRCDVSIVLNVSSDHLGMDGVDTLEELADVKAVVARAASRAVVLNAEDRLCVAMAARIRTEVELIWFALNAENPHLLRHLEHGGRGAYMQDGALVLADGTRRRRLVNVADMPSAMGGHARHNIANALATAAALMACGFIGAQIAHGLATFVSDGRHNPLRANLFDVRGVQVVVDYAHNPAAHRAIASMARGLSKGRVVGVVTTPGDRRNEDLRAVGETCGALYDDVVIYEAERRGRAEGETAALIAAGAEANGNRAAVHIRIAVTEAVRHGLALCREGDVLVFACGSSLNELVAALRGSDPETASRIAAEGAL